MKNKIFYTILCFLFLFAGIVTVDAATLDKSDGTSIIDDLTDTLEVQNSEGKYKIKIKDDAAATVALDLIFKDNDDVEFDLNGHTLTNNGAKLSAIEIRNNTTKVTIIDSKGNGKITYNSNSAATGGTYTPLINNAGTLEIKSGTIDANKGSTVKNAGPIGTGIYNSGKLNISGGVIKASVEGAWGINNVVSGVLTIEEGTFAQEKDFSIINNDGKMYINGGTFTSTEEGNSLLTNTTEGTIEITAGDIQANKKIFHNDAENENITITGGSYELIDGEVNIDDYLPEGYTLGADGKVVAPQPEPTPQTPTNTTNNPNTHDSILASFISLIVLLVGVGIVGINLKKKIVKN